MGTVVVKKFQAFTNVLNVVLYSKSAQKRDCFILIFINTAFFFSRYVDLLSTGEVMRSNAVNADAGHYPRAAWPVLVYG